MSQTSESRPVVLITGCSEPTSLGAALSHEFLKRGHRVFATARKLSALNELEGSGCDVLELDVSDAESIARAKAEVIRLTGGKLNFLINNAAMGDSAPTLELDLDKLRALYEVNTFGPLRMVQAFTPLLVNSAMSSGSKSVILNVGSVAAKLAVPFQGGYDSSKAALQTLSDVLRKEMKNLGVHVMTLELASINTHYTALMTSAVDTRAAEAVQSSTYYPNSDDIVQANNEMTRRDSPKAMPAQAAARGIVDAMVASSPKPKIWIGQNAWMIKWVFDLLPIPTLENMFSKMFGADKVLEPNFVQL
ncbi:hypothetical protein P7C73_g2312, partial [Tremellales sp. Uapishka_1]